MLYRFHQVHKPRFRIIFETAEALTPKEIEVMIDFKFLLDDDLIPDLV